MASATGCGGCVAPVLVHTGSPFATAGFQLGLGFYTSCSLLLLLQTPPLPAFLDTSAKPAALASAARPPVQPNMSEEECKAFVVKAVSHAMARDGSSGGCIRTVVISKDGIKRSFIPGDEVPVAAGELPPPVRQVRA